MLKFTNIGQQPPPKRNALTRKDDFNEIYRDYGRHSMPGLKLMGSMISKDFF